MKKNLLVIISVLCFQGITNAQELNWRALEENQSRHLLSLHLGLDYGSVYGIAYGYKLPGKLSLVLGSELLLPFGGDVTDDWKAKINIQSELWHRNHWSFAFKYGFIIRRYKSEVSRLYNFASEFTATFGYLKSSWGLTAEASYDKTLITHIRHDLLKDLYPDIQDGWFNATGGNLKFGLKANYVFNDSWSSFLRVGTVFGQDFENNPTLPFYLDISLLKSF